MRSILFAVGLLWAVWGSLTAGATVFLWLAPTWDVSVAYGVSGFAMTPVLGGIAASFLAPDVWGRSVIFALTELCGGYVVLGFASVLQGGARERKKAGDKANANETIGL